MALPEDKTASDKAADAAANLWGADGAGVLPDAAEPDAAEVLVAAASEGLEADLTLLGLQDLLKLPFDEDGPNGLQFGQSDAAAAASRSDRRGGASEVVKNGDLPADLTSVGLGQLLGLQLSGAALPTLGEVAAVDFDDLASSQRNNDDTNNDAGAQDGGEEDNGDRDAPRSKANFDDDPEQIFSDDPALTEQADLNSAAAAKAASQAKANGNPFSGDGEFPGQGLGLKDKLDAETFADEYEKTPPLIAPAGAASAGPSIINGTAAGELLNGTAGVDQINGLGGNDTLVGGAAADKLDGRDGTDTASYATSGSAVNVSLATGVGAGGHAEGDTLVSIENLIGSDYADTLTGDANANDIEGGGGADRLLGGDGADDLKGNGGDDTLEGGAGNDTLNGGGGSDSLVGGDDDDDLSGLGGDDTLEGGAGADTLSGGGGDDTLVWDFNDLNIDGDAGTDTLRIDSGNADITTFGGTIAGIDHVDMESDGGANTLTVSYADVLAMTDNTDTLTIDGDAGDSLDADGGWTDGGIVGGYHIYTQGNGGNQATLQVDTDVSVNANILV